MKAKVNPTKADKPQRGAVRTSALLDIREETANDIAEYIEMRACDPWPVSMWPAANQVLKEIAEEIRRDYGTKPKSKPKRYV